MLIGAPCGVHGVSLFGSAALHSPAHYQVFWLQSLGSFQSHSGLWNACWFLPYQTSNRFQTLTGRQDNLHFSLHLRALILWLIGFYANTFSTSAAPWSRTTQGWFSVWTPVWGINVSQLSLHRENTTIFSRISLTALHFDISFPSTAENPRCGKLWIFFIRVSYCVSALGVFSANCH